MAGGLPFIVHPSSFILRFILHPSSFLLPMEKLLPHGFRVQGQLSKVVVSAGGILWNGADLRIVLRSNDSTEPSPRYRDVSTLLKTISWRRRIGEGNCHRDIGEPSAALVGEGSAYSNGQRLSGEQGGPCLALRAIKAKGGICDAGRQALGYLYATNRPALSKELSPGTGRGPDPGLSAG